MIPTPAIKALAATFPETFGLRGFPGKVFRVSLSSSYMGDDGRIRLYTEVRHWNGTWSDWAKGTEEELRREIVAVPP